MPDAELCILSTRVLDQSLTDAAAAKGIIIESIPFIQTTPVPEKILSETILPLLQQPADVIFTSVQAVISVSRFVKDSKPAWRIWCLNEATQKAAEKHFGSIPLAGTAANSEALAALIAGSNTAETMVFFCGNKRKDTIPQVLSRNGKPVKEVIVYTTEHIPHTITKAYDGIAFFSPSAVESFFSVNTISNKTACFAIGNTTAAALQPYLQITQKLFISPEHNAAALVQLITETLHAQSEK